MRSRTCSWTCSRDRWGKLSLLDQRYDVHGIVRADGEGEPTLGQYVALLNSARLTARHLSEHMQRQARGESLDDYIIDQYGRSNGDT